jgi:hypothetical protein
MTTTSITPDMEANVTGVEGAEEQRFQHARDCEGNHDSDNHTKPRHASALHHDHPPHGRPLRAERHTHRDLTCQLRNDVREHTVKTSRAEPTEIWHRIGTARYVGLSR